MTSTPQYAIVNTLTQECVTTNFITDGTESNIRVPYGIEVNPITHDIYITDARNYVNPGYLYCYSADGVKKWSVRTGDIPAHFAFLGTNKNEQ
jgi:DNA-binding beta-propeller fold protein YncE